MNAQARLVAFIWNRRWILLGVCLGLTLVAGHYAARVGVDNSLEIWFVEDDPALVSYHRFQDTYGNDESVVIAFHEPDGIVTERGKALLARAEAALRDVEGVAGVDSILDYAGDRTSKSLRADPLLVDRLLSRDGTSALMVVRMQALEAMDREREAILARIDRALEPLRTPYHKAGFGVLYAALNEISIVDGFALFCAAVALIGVLMIVLYRRWPPALLTLGIAVCATTWTMGLYGAAGHSLNMVTSILPTLVLVVTTASCMHVLLHVAARSEDGERAHRVIEGVGFMVRPCTLNTLTTAAGLLALATSPLPVVRDLGVFGAMGLLCALVLTLVGCTWALAWKRAEPAPADDAPLRRLSTRLCELAIRRPKRVLVVATLALAILLVSASRVEVDTYTIDFLYDDHPARRDSDFIESRVAPYTPLEFELRARDGALDLELLRAVARWQRDSEGTSGIAWSHSVIDVVAHAQRSIAGGDRDAYALPRTQADLDALIASIRTSEDAALLDTLVDENDGLRVTFGVPMQSARSLERTIDRVLAKAALPPGASVAPAGYLPLYVRMTSDIVQSQVASFAFAFVTVFAAIGVLLRSARMALLAVPANLIPVVFILGLMGTAGIRLDVATVTIAAVVLGLVVDDTVHLLHRFGHARATGMTQVEAVRAGARSAGHAILTTTLVLALGFSVFALAGIKSIAFFGLLVAAGLGAAAITDLMVAPALIVVFAARPATSAKFQPMHRVDNSVHRSGERTGGSHAD